MTYRSRTSPSSSAFEQGIHAVMEPRPLENKKLLVTGRFEHVDRETLKQRIEDAGGTNLSSISSKLDFLVAGAEAGPSKLRKAEELGIRLLSEEDILKILQGNSTRVP